jgi:hypothetical protein
VYKLFTFLLLSFTFTFGENPTSNEHLTSIETPATNNDAISASQENFVSDKDAPVHPNKPQSFKLMPHKATYSIRLSKKPNDPTISNVTSEEGDNTIELIKTKEGWTYKQNLEIYVHYNDGTITVIEKNVATCESSTEFFFHVEYLRDSVQESILQGKAERTEENGWMVYFQKPAMDGFITNSHLNFPIGHLEEILKAIGTMEKNQKVLSDQIVFDPTYETREALSVNSVITPSKEAKAFKNSTLLPSKKLWRVKDAIYELDSQNPTANYESTASYEESDIELFSTGVINSMEITLGEGITIALTLKELTVYQ